ncbi:MAG: hypothetical protein JW801_16400 [Bacteroidales bacterium]|nr:hypothetical protein [Bacteroidales bacterium]
MVSKFNVFGRLTKDGLNILFPVSDNFQYISPSGCRETQRVIEGWNVHNGYIRTVTQHGMLGCDELPLQGGQSGFGHAYRQVSW